MYIWLNYKTKQTTKRFILLAAFAALFIGLSGCGKDDGIRHGTLDINVRATATKAGDVLSPKEIVKQCWSMELLFENGEWSRRGRADRQRDTVNCKLLMYASDIIDEDYGTLHDDINARDFLVAKYAWLINEKEEVIAYIPSANLEEARRKIHAAYDKGDLSEVYRLFQDAYTAIPISQEDYDILKEEGRI